MLAAPLFAVAILAAPVPHYENDEPLTAPPKVGQEAPDFTLPELGEKEPVMLSTLSEDGPVVLMVLRGYPGYQCPICSRQVGAYLREAEAFEKLGAKVVMIYPGPEKNLQRFAREFAGGLDLPDGFTFLMDPGYTFTNAYKLRWDAPRETAYPSTFVIGTNRKVTFAKVSRGHGGRTKPAEPLAALRAMKD